MATARNRRDPDPQQGVYMISVAAELEKEMSDEIERVRKQFRAEIVRYEPPGTALRMRRRRA